MLHIFGEILIPEEDWFMSLTLLEEQSAVIRFSHNVVVDLLVRQSTKQTYTSKHLHFIKILLGSDSNPPLDNGWSSSSDTSSFIIGSTFTFTIVPLLLLPRPVVDCTSLWLNRPSTLHLVTYLHMSSGVNVSYSNMCRSPLCSILKYKWNNHHQNNFTSKGNLTF